LSGRRGSGSDGDPTSICKSRAHNTCIGFTTCCNALCQHNTLANECTIGQLDNAVCRCPAGVTIDADRYHAPTSRPLSGGSGLRDPIRDGGSLFGDDHTATCKITARDNCIEFRRCCSTKCETRFSSRCSGDGRGRLMSAFCRCTSSTTTTFGRDGSTFPRREGTSLSGDTTFPRRETPGTASGFHDFTETCRDLAVSGSCDSFRLCCNSRCRPYRDQNQSCSSSGNRITTARCSCTA